MMPEPYDVFMDDTLFETCLTCDGEGGWDASVDCESYDEWIDCIDCEGTGSVLPVDNDLDIFVPERDAFTAND